MIVASIGIFVGATFSSGMMEVARKGVFNPEYFFFGEIMIIFIAVMLTDIILLDFFNTIGLPTSTTVSIVFELLGAAVCMSLIKISNNGESIATISDYINSSQAILIISGIFLSVVFAFLIGTAVQYFSRIIFSFQYQKKKKIVRSLWTSLAMTAMTFFLLLKGLSGASFVSESFLNWLQSELLLTLSIAFVVWFLLMFILASRKIDVFKIVVLFGTFALAMAFAGNDLVNFIGVPIAGFESYLSWHGSGFDANSYSMEVLQEPVRTKSYLLIIAGAIMILTLWFSKKARSVTDTEVNLGRQDEGHERFSPNGLARGIVRRVISTGDLVGKMNFTQNKFSKSFVKIDEGGGDKPAFDLVRAGVNLTTASILIGFATSLKLPLSTTYVSFMVAMGTSLADRAWGRDSAVYRVAGVLNVIGGWFATAIIAFVASALFTLLIFSFKLGGIILLLSVAAFLIFRNFVNHRKEDKKKQKRVSFETQARKIAFTEFSQNTSERILQSISGLQKSFTLAIQGLITENTSILNEAIDEIKKLIENNEDLQYELVKSVKRIEEPNTDGSRILLNVFDLEQDIFQSADLIVKSCDEHVRNMLNPLKAVQRSSLEKVSEDVKDYLDQVKQFMPTNGDHKVAVEKKDELIHLLDDILDKQIIGIKKNKFGARNSQLIFKIILETKDIIRTTNQFVELFLNLKKVGKEEVVADLLKEKETKEVVLR